MIIRLWDTPTRARTVAGAKRDTEEHNNVVDAYFDALRVARTLVDGWHGRDGACINVGAEVFQQARAAMKRFESEFANQAPAVTTPTDVALLLRIARNLEEKSVWYQRQTQDSHGINEAVRVMHRDLASAIRDAINAPTTP